MYSFTCLTDNRITVASVDRKYSAIYDNIASSVEEWWTREHDKDSFFPFSGDKKIQTFHEYLAPQAGYAGEPEPCPTANIHG